jgi:malate dehydrogenase
MVAKGEVFGPNQEIILHLLDIAPMMGVLEGVVMELADCALPLLREVVPTADPAVGFKDVSAAFLVGAMPRREGMERKDLLSLNVKIFKVQGQALDTHAKKDVKVLVVGNPANTNALVCSHYAPSIPKENFTAMTRLDQNRARAQVAAKVGVPVVKVKNVIIWGNHSSTQFPDATNALVNVGGVDKSVSEVIGDAAYLSGGLLFFARS